MVGKVLNVEEALAKHALQKLEGLEHRPDSELDCHDDDSEETA